MEKEVGYEDEDVVWMRGGGERLIEVVTGLGLEKGR